jgi:triosephosphate isomerase
LIGHSERRRVFGETNAEVQKKVKAALAAGLKPILAVGETAQERKARKTLPVIRTQLSFALNRFPKDAYKELIVAYEPVWAIGTGLIPKPDEIEEVHAFIRKRVGRNPRIVYGGSMSPANVRDIMRQKSVQGGLVGGASLDAGKFADLIREGTRVYDARMRKA